MKIVFLDIDGVLVPIDSKIAKIKENKIVLLKKLLDETDAKVVLSSTWRVLFLPQNRDEELYEYLIKLLNKYNIEIYDITPIKHMKTMKKKVLTRDGKILINYVFDPYTTRVGEINEWLSDKDIESFVILDDEDFNYEFFSLDKNFVKIENPLIGLQETDINKAKKILNIKNKTRIK